SRGVRHVEGCEPDAVVRAARTQIGRDDQLDVTARGELFGDMRTEESRASGDQHPSHGDVPTMLRPLASPPDEPVRFLVCRAHRLATMRPATMSQMPHHPATIAMPPNPSKNANTMPRPRPALRMPTSKVIAFRSRVPRPPMEAVP